MGHPVYEKYETAQKDEKHSGKKIYKTIQKQNETLENYTKQYKSIWREKNKKLCNQIQKVEFRKEIKIQ